MTLDYLTKTQRMALRRLRHLHLITEEQEYTLDRLRIRYAERREEEQAFGTWPFTPREANQLRFVRWRKDHS